MPLDSSISTVDRILRLVELLLTHPDGLTPQELLLHLDISRSSLFMVLRSLKSLGYVEQSEKRGRYRLGPRLEAWRASPSLASQGLLSAFYQDADRREWQETLLLLIPSSEGVVVLAQIEGTASVRCVFTPGYSLEPGEVFSRIFSPSPGPELVNNGYLYLEDEDIHHLALPLCRDGVHADAALMLTAPCFRWKKENFLQENLSEMRNMAARLSYQIGASFYAPYSSQDQPWSQPVEQLSEEEIGGFVNGPWTARLACIRPDGLPHVIPVWQVWDGECFYVFALKGSQWSDYVLANPNVSLTIDEPWLPLRRIVARGRVELLDQHTNTMDLEGLLQEVSLRYYGQQHRELIEQVGQVFRILPEHLRGWKGTPWQTGKNQKAGQI